MAGYIPSLDFLGASEALGKTLDENRLRSEAYEILHNKQQPSFLDRMLGVISPSKPAEPVAAPVAAVAPVGGGPFGVPDTLWRAQIGQESGGNQFGDNGRPLTSPKGATGIAQVMPGTAPEAAQLAGVPFDPQRYKTDPVYNETLGRAYMGAQMQRFGDPVKALAAYNAGPQRVEDAVARHGESWLTHMPAETQDYVARITQRAAPTQTADLSGRVTVGGSAPLIAPEDTDRALAALKGFPEGLRTPEGIAKALASGNPYLEKMAHAANTIYTHALAMEERRAAREAPPAIIKEYDYARKQGYAGTLQDFRQSMKPETNVTLSGEKAYEQTVGKGYGETMLDIQKQGRSAQNSITSLKLMEKAIETPGFYSGAASDAVTSARKVAVSLGVTDAASAAPNELFTKISNKLVLDLAGGSLGTGFSNADRDYLAASVPNLANTPEGNKQIIQIMKKVEGRRAEVAKFARDYAKFHNGRLDAGFDDALAQWTEQNKLFPEGEKTVAAPMPKLGSVPIPPDRARALRQHPDLRDAFDQTYGKGAADQVLGVTGGPQL